MDGYFVILYTEINFFCIMIIVAIMLKALGVAQMTSTILFIKALATMMVFFSSDNLCVFITSGTVAFMPGVLIVLKSIYFMFTTIMCYYWFLYFDALREDTSVSSLKFKLRSAIPVMVQGVLTVVNFFNGMFFYTANGVYFRGPLFGLQYAFSYLYIVIAIWRVIRAATHERNYIDKNTVLTYALFPIFPAEAGLLQYFFADLPLACVALTFSTLLLYFNHLENSISVDPLTRLSNRKQLMWHLSHKLKSYSDGKEESNLCVIMCDANLFKQINDTYGHTEGDAALIRISLALKSGCTVFKKRALIARFGGDEFTVVCEVDDKDEVKRAEQRIASDLSTLNKEANVPYNLTVSLGHAFFNNDISTVKQFISAADEELYKAKEESRKITGYPKR